MFQVQRQGTWLLDLQNGTMRKVMADPTAEAYTGRPTAAASRTTAVRRRQMGRLGDGAITNR